MTLETYNRKRNFARTPEPEGKLGRRVDALRFVVQEHHARQLHFDFRLEMGGVLKSWAVPKGPSLDPKDRRLAVDVEDHPVDYLLFEGEISEGNYGAGQVVVWDTGTYTVTNDDDPLRAYESGKLTFILNGEKLQGQFNLIRLANRKNQWLLFKSKDEFAQPGWELEAMLKDGEVTAKSAGTRKRATPRRSETSPSTRPAAKPKETLHVVSNGTAVDVENVVRAPMPEKVEPMLATLVDKPFSDPEWVYEFKWDGVRALCFIEDGKARFVSRNQKEMNVHYPELANIAGAVQAKQAILDGEIVALDENGHPSFQLLQSRIGLLAEADIERLAGEHPAIYYVFDIVYYDGMDLRTTPLHERQALLRAILTEKDTVRISEAVPGKGEELFARAVAEGMEGMVAKQRDSVYEERRSESWLKLKAVQEQEVVIGGYTEPRGTRTYFGALVVGLYQDKKLVAVGHVGGGFNRKTLKQVYNLMQPLKTTRSPFAEPPPTNEAVQWIKPELVAQVKFAEWTAERQMRQPIFLGLREDKDAQECTVEPKRATAAEVPVADAKAAHASAAKRRSGRAPSKASTRARPKKQAAEESVELTHLDKVYFPEAGYTKGDLIEYYRQVADTLVPYLTDRPLILKRYPNGIAAPMFFQHEMKNPPEFLRTVTLESEAGRPIDYAIIDTPEALLYVTNLGTIEEHPWHSRVADIDHPDYVVFDLDPEKADFKTVSQVALALRDLLERLGLKVWAKTSGSRGMHVYVPIEPRYEYEQVARLAERIAALVAKENPKWATMQRALNRREAGHVYVDHLQNAKGKTVAAPYSVRARPGATVSTPLEWKEVEKGVDPAAFTLKMVPARLKKKGDLFRGVIEHKQSLDRALERLDQEESRVEKKPQRKVAANVPPSVT